MLAQIGRGGMTVWCCMENISTTERDKIQKILGAMGHGKDGMFDLFHSSECLTIESYSCLCLS